MESGSSSPQRRISSNARADRGKAASSGGPLSPPYWQHQRFASNASIESVRPARRSGITLEDHTEESSEQSGTVWAKSVTIDDHVVISGSRTGVGAYVVWNCTVETLDGGPMKIRKRYSEFDELRTQLLETFPKSGTSMPPLPPKSVISKFRPQFLEKRREGLSYFLNCVLLNPEFSGAPVLKDFLFT